jgi:predicted nuclease of predicted toxin-antitoxin system
MKILCDVHIAIKVAKFLSSKGVETQHVNTILDKWHTKDDDICIYADKHDFVVLTKDAGFKNSHFVNQTPKKLIKVNLGNISTKDLIRIFDVILEQLQAHFQDNETCYIEINPNDIIVIGN